MTVFCDLLLGLTTDSPTRLSRLLYLLSTFWDEEGYCVKSKRCHGDMLRCHLHMHWPRKGKTTASSRFPRFCLNILRDRPLLPCQAYLRAVLWSCTDVLALLLGVVEPSRPVWLVMCACALHSYTLPPTGIFFSLPFGYSHIQLLPINFKQQTGIGWWHLQPLNKETQIF